MPQKDRIDRIEYKLAELTRQTAVIPARLGDAGGGGGVDIVRGTTTAAVSALAATFQLENLEAVSGSVPSSPLTVQQVFPVGYASGQAAIAIKAANGDWINTPDAGKVRTNSLDTTPEHLAESIVDTTTFDSDFHQVVYVQAEDIGSGNYRAKLFTLKASEGVSYAPGCGIAIISNVISVDPVDLAGDGLVADDTTCELHVDVGCGLQIDGAGKLEVNPSDIAGKGLKEVAGSECAELELDLGCGLQFDGVDKVAIDRTALAGDGLAADSGTCNLKVNVGCGLQLTSGEVRFKRDDVMGSGLVADSGTCNMKVDRNVTVNSVTGVTVSASGTTLTVTINYTPYEVYGVAGSPSSFSDNETGTECT